MMKMKKLLVLFCSAGVLFMAGCSSEKATTETAAPAETAQTVEATPAVEEAAPAVTEEAAPAVEEAAPAVEEAAPEAAPAQ